MDERRKNIILDHLNQLVNKFEINEQFCKSLLDYGIFPKSYVENLKFSTIDSINKKKNLLIDITRREPSSYHKLSTIFRELYNCSILDFYDKDFYPNQNPGYCLIINNEIFTSIMPRNGSSVDVAKFSTTFENLNFKVVIHNDLSKKEMKNLLEQISNDHSLENFDIFVLIVMSHGYSEHIVTSDEKYMSYDEIMLKFSNQKCPYLVNKPKIIIFNCCREALSNDIKQNIDHLNQDVSIGQEIKDMIEIFSTLDKNLSVRDENTGTFFAQAFTQSLNEYSDCEINKILLNANKLLMKRAKEESNTIEPKQAIETRFLGVEKSIYFQKKILGK